MQLTDETPVGDLLAWLDKNNVYARTFFGGDDCPCCGTVIADGQVTVVLYDRAAVDATEEPLIIGGGSGKKLTEAYAAAIERYPDDSVSDDLRCTDFATQKESGS